MAAVLVGIVTLAVLVFLGSQFGLIGTIEYGVALIISIVVAVVFSRRSGVKSETSPQR